MKTSKLLGQIFGEVLGFLIGNAIISALIYVILVFMIGYHVFSFVQIWGILMLVNILRNLIFGKTR
jgi:hypothetical protein